MLIERFSYDLGFGKCSICSIFVLSANRWKDQNMASSFSRQKLDWRRMLEKSLFDWQVMLQYDIKAKYRLISRKFSGMHVFCFCFVCAFSFWTRSYENRFNHWRMLGPCLTETGRIKVQKGNTVLPVTGGRGGGRGYLQKWQGFLSYFGRRYLWFGTH